MKTLLLLTVGLFSVMGFSQESWDYLPIEITNNYHGAIYPIDENVVHVVSDYGNFYKTMDGGETWSQFDSGVNEYFFDLSFDGPDNGYAVGNNGKILKTSNAGQTWAERSSESSEALISIDINLPNSIWIVGESGTVLHSTDHGNSWVLNTLLTTQNLNDIKFKDENIGYVAGDNGTLLYTENGGNDWVQLTIPSSYDLFSLSFNGDFIYLVSGEATTYFTEYGFSGNQLYKSNNNIDWDFYELNQMEYGPADIFFTNQNTGYSINSAMLLCDCCFVTIEKALDGGQTWDYSLNEETDAAGCNANVGYADIVFASEQVGYVLLGSQILKTPYQSTAGLNEMKIDQAFIIYPNPSNEGQFNVKLYSSNLKGLSMEIIDIYGRSIYSYDNLKEHNIFSLPTISEGIYFINILKNGRVLNSQKLIGGL